MLAADKNSWWHLFSGINAGNTTWVMILAVIDTIEDNTKASLILWRDRAQKK